MTDATATAAPHRPILLLAVGVSFGVIAGQAFGGGELHVELDIFSGRPNPEWSLTNEQAAELHKLLDSLPVADTLPPRFDGLGYRGIVVTDPSNPGWTLVVFRETVNLLTARTTDAKADPERSLERWLLESSDGSIDQTLRARIGN